MYKQFINVFANTQNRFRCFASIRTITNSTIFAISSGYGKCGVAVIRVSGPETRNTIKLITGAETLLPTQLKSNYKTSIRPRYASLRRLRYPDTNDLIDTGLVLWFPEPHSFTGEDCCEFQVHGGTAIVSAMFDALNSINGLRPALPGEFTRRAFRSNKLDLSEVEGLADLIHAETEIQRKQAILQANGTLSKLYNDWRQRILRTVAFLEAYIDFAEDENIEPETMDHVQNDVQLLIDDLKAYLNDSRKGEMRRNGVKTVILGKPNVGKSSLMNHICQKPISIVASIEGTTRDIVETSFNIGGFPVIFADTAGLRKNTLDPIEREGISRAIKYAGNADLIMLLIDATDLVASKQTLSEFKQSYLKQLGIENDENILQKNMIVIVNKIDLIDEKMGSDQFDDATFISCTQNKGIDQAIKKIESMLSKLTDCDATAMTLCAPNDRHRQFLFKALEHLQEFKRFTQLEDFDYSIAALHLRESMHELENIAGKSIDNEKIYDVIFKQFCIGK